MAACSDDVSFILCIFISESTLGAATCHLHGFAADSIGSDDAAASCSTLDDVTAVAVSACFLRFFETTFHFIQGT
jgi:hypothetical protein